LIERIADLFLRMRTTEAEVAATVHFAAMSLARSMHDKPSEEEVLAEVLRWKQRRRPPLSEVEIARTIRNLAALGWLDVKPSPDLPVPEEVGVDV
jgi:wyosine [tRNA(Phe)-imidazoG37] synthetase (radical SAM superfamily)